jgi:hypothetical protein
MTYKKLTCGFLIALAAFVVLNFAIWKCCTERLLTDSDGPGGDLARTGYLVGAKLPRRATVNLPRRHLEFKDYQGQKIDVLTIGDSFSSGGGGGLNSCYQDYISSFNAANVLNLGMFNQRQGPLATLIVLLNSGYLDVIKPKAIILQTVARIAVERFGQELSFAEILSIDEISQRYQGHIEAPTALPPVRFINTGNMKYLYYSMRYLVQDSPTRQVLVKKLTKPFFSTELSDRLLFWHDDIDNLVRQTPEAMLLLNENLNRMADLLDQKGIHLYFMPAVDKYDLYSEYIVNNPYPPNLFFERMRSLPKRYRFIDTKAILAEALRQGEKDLYYPDDTHWSWKASERIFKQVRFE